MGEIELYSERRFDYDYEMRFTKAQNIDLKLFEKAKAGIIVLSLAHLPLVE